MTKFECDVCGKSVESAQDLTEYKSAYQMEHIKESCKDCFPKISNKLYEIQTRHGKEATEELKHFIVRLKD